MNLPFYLIPVLVAGLFLVYGTLQAVLNAFVRPLSKVPGPKLYSISGLPYIYHLVRGEWPHALKKLHDRYGPVVRYTPNDVSFATAGAWKEIYGHKNDASKNFQKDRRLYRPTLSGYSNLITASDSEHKRMRRLLSHPFSEKALRNQEWVLKSYVDFLIQRLGEAAQSDNAVDIVRWYNYTTFDLIGDLAFGEPFGCQKNSKYHPWVSMIFATVQLAAYTQAIRRMPSLAPLAALLVPKKFARNLRENFMLSRATALRRVESKNIDREDFMSYILRHNDEHGMCTEEIIENASALIFAGSETTATVLSGTTFHLLTNRGVYDKLVDEIRSTFNAQEEITMSRVNSLTYLLATLDEGLRMYPPVPTGLPRFTPPGGYFIEGYFMPENTIVSVAQWASYQSDQNWRDPQRFAPERWLGDPYFADDKRDVLKPFSVGPRNCIGKNLAYAEMRIILARVLWSFDLELMEERKHWDRQKIYNLWKKGALNVKLSPSERSKEEHIAPQYTE